MIIQNQRELDILRENWKIHKEIFEEIKKMVTVWTRWSDVDELCQTLCNKYWVLPWFKWVYWFPANICISVNSAVVHWLPTKKMVFKEWDVVKFDFWVKDKRIWINTDSAFTMIIGDWPKDSEVVRFIKCNEEALLKGIAAAKVWNRVWDIWNAIQTTVESAWFHIVRDLTWHALWYNLHEKPYIYNYWIKGNWQILREWQVLAIEPIIWFSSWKVSDKWGWEIYIADWSLGSQAEHTIVVREWYPEIIV